MTVDELVYHLQQLPADVRHLPIVLPDTPYGGECDSMDVSDKRVLLMPF